MREKLSDVTFRVIREPNRGGWTGGGSGMFAKDVVDELRSGRRGQITTLFAVDRESGGALTPDAAVEELVRVGGDEIRTFLRGIRINPPLED